MVTLFACAVVGCCYGTIHPARLRWAAASAARPPARIIPQAEAVTGVEKSVTISPFPHLVAAAAQERRVDQARAGRVDGGDEGILAAAGGRLVGGARGRVGDH